MHIREALTADIPALHAIRMSVKENVLNNPALVTPQHYQDFLTQKGKGWLCSVEETIAGFAILDLEDPSIWALFVDPRFEGQGIGQALHRQMLDWYFSNYHQPLWLATAPGTRAETFYTRSGWKPIGHTPHGEVRFEINPTDWKN